MWITSDNDQRDVLIDAGQSFLASGTQRLLVYALEQARVRVSRGLG